MREEAELACLEADFKKQAEEPKVFAAGDSKSPSLSHASSVDSADKGESKKDSQSEGEKTKEQPKKGSGFEVADPGDKAYLEFKKPKKKDEAEDKTKKESTEVKETKGAKEAKKDTTQKQPSKIDYLYYIAKLGTHLNSTLVLYQSTLENKESKQEFLNIKTRYALLYCIFKIIHNFKALLEKRNESEHSIFWKLDLYSSIRHSIIHRAGTQTTLDSVIDLANKLVKELPKEILKMAANETSGGLAFKIRKPLLQAWGLPFLDDPGNSKFATEVDNSFFARELEKFNEEYDPSTIAEEIAYQLDFEKVIWPLIEDFKNIMSDLRQKLAGLSSQPTKGSDLLSHNVEAQRDFEALSMIIGLIAEYTAKETYQPEIQNARANIARGNKKEEYQILENFFNFLKLCKSIRSVVGHGSKYKADPNKFREPTLKEMSDAMNSISKIDKKPNLTLMITLQKPKTSLSETKEEFKKDTPAKLDSGASTQSARAAEPRKRKRRHHKKISAQQISSASQENGATSAAGIFGKGSSAASCSQPAAMTISSVAGPAAVPVSTSAAPKAPAKRPRRP